MTTNCFIIAEAGVNHNGSVEMAKELVDIAAESGADAVKFQTFKATQLVTASASTAEYQNSSTGETEQFSMLSKLEMSEEMHLAVIARCEQKNIEFMSTAFDSESLDFLIEHGMKRIKIPSGEITNHPLLAQIASKDIPMILSTGMADMAEIQEAVEVISDVRTEKGFALPLNQMLTILHCTSNYPAAAKDVNLRAMNSIAEKFQLPVGYSDHTLGVAISTAAVGMGASVIEKHFTIDKNLPGPDHATSLEKDELSQLVSMIRMVSEGLGSHEKKPSASELPVRSLVRRSVALKNSVEQGHIFTENDLILLRPANGIQPKEMQTVIGRAAKVSIEAGTTLTWDEVL